jgi:hypothetical protein
MAWPLQGILFKLLFSYLLLSGIYIALCWRELMPAIRVSVYSA